MSTPQIADWLGLPDSAAFVELVRHNVVLPADADPWVSVVRGELPPLGAEELRVVAAAGPAFFAAAAAALDRSGPDLHALAALLKQETGRGGAQLFMPLRVALTGKTHGPELAPILKLLPPETARRRLESHARDT
jgi:glutamyl-tRNA synthetase